MEERGPFPEYFKQDGEKMVAVPASQVPGDRARGSDLRTGGAGKAYTSPTTPSIGWTVPGPKSGPHGALADGSESPTPGTASSISPRCSTST